MSTAATSANAKTLSTLAERFALAGGQFNVETTLAGGERYIVELCGRMREFESVAQLEELLDVIGEAS